MSSIWRELRLALGVLRHSPGFAAVAVVTLGLGIAASATVFGWIDTVLLRPIGGVHNAQELVVLEGIAPDGARLASFPHPDFRDFQQQLTSASGVVATHTTSFTVGPVDHPRRALGQVVSANFFAVLGVQPLMGRLFAIEEDRDDNGAHPIAVISHRLWAGYFQSDAGIVGQTVRISGRMLTIVGVTPPDFHGTFGGAAMDVWVPLSMSIQVGALNTWAAADRNARFLDVLVRLKPGLSITQALHEAQGIAQRIAAAYPDTHQGIGATLVPVWQASNGLQRVLREPLQLLSLVCLLVLLIACANVANLLMARSIARQREFGIRMALGAGSGTLVRSLLFEVLTLAGTAAAGGIGLAQWLGNSMAYVFPVLDSSIQAAAEPLFHPTLTPQVMIFTALLAITAALVATILPAIAVSRMNVNETLKEGGRSGTVGTQSHRARGALVVAEVALASMALVGAGLAIRSFQKYSSLPTGFDPRNVLVTQFFLSNNGYSLEQERQFCRNLILRMEAASGIEKASCAESVPLSFISPTTERVQVDGSPADQRGVMAVRRSVVAPGYFDLMRIPLLAGRDFTDQDDRKKELVIIVNQTFARKYFEGQDPLGRKVRVSGKLSTIVGMVKDSKYRSPQEPPTPFFYGPFRQIFFSGHRHFFYLRTKGNLDGARLALRTAVAELDANSGPLEMLPLENHTEAALVAERVAASLLSVLGLLSVVLAAAGLYSVMAYAVNERRQEFGIRMALGASRMEVLKLVLRNGLTLTVAGLAAGGVAVIASALVASNVWNVPLSFAEPLVFVGAALVLLAITVLATYVPAWRATKVDPMIAVRSQ